MNLKTQTKASQVTFSHRIYINKSISSNFHLDNMLKKLSSRKYTWNKKQVSSTYATLKKDA